MTMETFNQKDFVIRMMTLDLVVVLIVIIFIAVLVIVVLVTMLAVETAALEIIEVAISNRGEFVSFQIDFLLVFWVSKGSRYRNEISSSLFSGPGS